MGCGGIGARHLQALGNTNFPLNIFVVDKSEKSILNAKSIYEQAEKNDVPKSCLLYTSPSPRDRTRSRMPSSA